MARVATLRVAIGEPADAASDPELRLAELARSRAPLRRVLARIAGRIVATRASDRLGFARLGDWARERVGLSARQIQDLARVDERLGALPRIEAAFVRGDLTWSKTRLLVGVARAEDEDRWVAHAMGVTVHALERQVRALGPGPIEAFGVATDEDGADDEPSERITVACAPRVRAKFHRAREIARRVAGEALPTWACMEAVAAEALSALGPIPPGEQEADCEVTALTGASWSDRAGSAASGDPLLLSRAGPPIDSPDGSTDPVGSLPGAPMANVCATPAAPDRPLALVANVCAPPLPSWLRSLVEGIEAADAFELDDRMRRAVALEQRIDAEMAPLLRAIGASRRYRRAGVQRFEAWARERLGISPRKTRALVRLARAGDACPTLREAFRSGRLSWVQAHALAPILLVAESAPFRDEWVAWAEHVSVRRLEADVAAALLLLETNRAAFVATAGLPRRQTCAQAQGDRDAGAIPAATNGPEPAHETARIAFVAPRDVALFFRSVFLAARARLEHLTNRPVSAGEAIEWMLDHAFAAWGADDDSLAPEHRVYDRDGWRCTVPGCSSYRNLHDHHIVYRSRGGSDDLRNRTTLCACHHQRGVHGGLVRCAGSAPDGLRFELGLRTGRPPLVSYVAGERCAEVTRVAGERCAEVTRVAG